MKELVKVNVVKHEKGVVEEDLLELVFDDDSKEYILISEIKYIDLSKKLQQENKQLKERIERIDNYLDKNYTAENQYWFDHIRDIIEDR